MRDRPLEATDETTAIIETATIIEDGLIESAPLLLAAADVLRWRKETKVRSTQQ